MALRDAGAGCVAMEVSPHALDQQRIAAVRLRVAAFTNLTRDHLDYHGTMEAYGEAKARLLGWPGLAARVVNVDDPFGAVLARRAGPGRLWVTHREPLSAGLVRELEAAGARAPGARELRATARGIEWQLEHA
ncbi:MAG: Mur ligase family protein [Steroidobacteraceae bacterium]